MASVNLYKEESLVTATFIRPSDRDYPSYSPSSEGETAEVFISGGWGLILNGNTLPDSAVTPDESSSQILYSVEPISGTFTIGAFLNTQMYTADESLNWNSGAVSTIYATPITYTISDTMPPLFSSSWTQVCPTGATPSYGPSVAFSDDGKVIYILAKQTGYANEYKSIYRSKDSGTTWVRLGSESRSWLREDWTAICCSYDGSIVFVASGTTSSPGGNIYTSANYGQSWSLYSSGSTHWTNLKCSVTGTYVLALSATSSPYDPLGSLYLGTKLLDNSVAFTAIPDSVKNWSSIAMSSTGKIMYALNRLNSTVGETELWESTDYGVTWDRARPLPSSSAPYIWETLTCSFDGKKLVLGSQFIADYAAGFAGIIYSPGLMYVSNDGGDTWIEAPVGKRKWNHVSMSADGQHIFACAAGRLFMSENGGEYWVIDQRTQATRIFCDPKGRSLYACGDSLSTASLNDAITLTNVQEAQVTLSWAAVSNNLPIPGPGITNLYYWVFYSTSPLMDTATEVIAHGTLVDSSLLNTTTKTVTGLNPALTYYFNVIVSDANSLTSNLKAYSKAVKTAATVYLSKGGAASVYGISSTDTGGGDFVPLLPECDISGSGTPVISYAVTDSDGNTYVCGRFNEIGGVAASSVAKWNGSAWSPLVGKDGEGLGSNGTAYRLVMIRMQDGGIWKNYLWVFGVFTQAGGRIATNIACYKLYDSDWQAVGNGTATSATGLAILKDDTDIYIGGGFTQIGGTSVNRIAKITGGGSALGTVSTLGTGAPSGLVSRIISTGTTGQIYACGTFPTIGGVTAKFIAKWNGSVWSALGAGTATGTNIGHMALSGTDLYVAGSFTVIGGTISTNMAKWTGSAWTAVSGVLTLSGASISALVADGTDIYVGGRFVTIGGMAGTAAIGKWNGSAWSALDGGFTGTTISSYNQVTGLAVVGAGAAKRIYACGILARTADGKNDIRYVAKWDGSAWTPAAPYRGYYGPRTPTLAVEGTTVYVMGSHKAQQKGYIATCDGTTSSLFHCQITPINSSLNFVEIGSDFYLSGEFIDFYGDDTLRGVVKYNGSTWSVVGDGSLLNLQLIAVGLTLYGILNSSVYKWNGTSWTLVGLTNALIKYFCSDGSSLYVSGAGISSISSVSVQNTAKFDGSMWSALSGIASTSYGRLYSVGTDVYCSTLALIATGECANLYKLNGSSWEVKDSNVDVAYPVLVGSTLYALTTGVLETSISKWDNSPQHDVQTLLFSSKVNLLDGEFLIFNTSSLLKYGIGLTYGTPTASAWNGCDFRNYTDTSACTDGQSIALAVKATLDSWAEFPHSLMTLDVSAGNGTLRITHTLTGEVKPCQSLNIDGSGPGSVVITTNTPGKFSWTKEIPTTYSARLDSVGTDLYISGEFITRFDDTDASLVAQWNTETRKATSMNFTNNVGLPYFIPNTLQVFEAESVADTTAPVPGTSISFSNVTGTSLSVNWGAASDDITSTASLQYKVVKAATSGAIDTVGEADAITGGDLLMDWTANTLTKAVTSLTNGTTYYFAVLVKDEAGNKALYSPAAQATLDTTAPILGADINFTNVAETALTVNWGVASDNVTAQANLQYKVVKAATSEAIDTVGEVDAIIGSDLVMDWTANTLTTGVTNLTAGTKYYFAVLMKDEAGNKALYTPAAQVTLGTTVMTSGTITPDIDGNITLTSDTLIPAGANVVFDVPDVDHIILPAGATLQVEPEATLQVGGEIIEVREDTVYKLRSSPLFPL